MLDWTEERQRSETSRQGKGRDRSWRVRVWEEEVEGEVEEVAKSLRVWRMVESGLSLFLKGRSSSALVRRRFLLSAMDGEKWVLWWWDQDAEVVAGSEERPNLVVLLVLVWAMVCYGGMGQAMAWREEGETATLAAARGGCCDCDEVDL